MVLCRNASLYNIACVIAETTFFSYSDFLISDTMKIFETGG